jgi:hypothetical protein
LRDLRQSWCLEFWLQETRYLRQRQESIIARMSRLPTYLLK